MERVSLERLDGDAREAERCALRERIRDASAVVGSYVAACPEARQFYEYWSGALSWAVEGFDDDDPD